MMIFGHAVYSNFSHFSESVPGDENVKLKISSRTNAFGGTLISSSTIELSLNSAFCGVFLFKRRKGKKQLVANLQ